MSTSTVTFQGNPLTLTGTAVNTGDPAPDFTVLANDLSPVTTGALKGRITILLAVPSLDTPVCDAETRRFNLEAATLGDTVSILCVSMDLPFAQARWCGIADIDNLQTVSDHRDASFGSAFGILIQELRLLARSVFIIDAEGIIRYKEIVPELTNEPDYEAVLQAVKELL
jgi:thiol peroxidase